MRRTSSGRQALSDIVDLAQAAEALHLSLSMAAARNQPGRLLPVGSCHNCGEELQDNASALFCSADCRDDYEYRARLLHPK
jgi:hypothetical protein